MALGEINTSVGAGPRVERLSASDAGAADLVERLIRLAADGLPAMRIGPGAFAFTRRAVVSDGRGILRLEGRSERYTGMTILGARHLSSDEQRTLLGGLTAREAADALVHRLDLSAGLGDIAVAAWAAAETGAPVLDQALELLRKSIAATPVPFVVEQAWVVSALVAARRLTDVEIDLEVARDRLLGSRIGGVLFPTQTAPGLVPQWRAHVGCFADQVYPIQALARLHASESDLEALTASQAAADAICRLQGDRGQWWWHYDAGRDAVVEGFPVYSVHQHAMAPMALLDLADAGGELDVQAIIKGLRWLEERPETDEPFIRWTPRRDLAQGGPARPEEAGPRGPRGDDLAQPVDPAPRSRPADAPDRDRPRVPPVRVRLAARHLAARQPGRLPDRVARIGRLSDGNGHPAEQCAVRHRGRRADP